MVFIKKEVFNIFFPIWKLTYEDVQVYFDSLNMPVMKVVAFDAEEGFTYSTFIDLFKESAIGGNYYALPPGSSTGYYTLTCRGYDCGKGCSIVRAANGGLKGCSPCGRKNGVCVKEETYSEAMVPIIYAVLLSLN